MIEELKEKALQLCYAIEDLPASEQQTKISIMASDLHGLLEKLVMPKTGGINFKYNFGDKVWIKDLECYGRVLSCWHTRSGLQYEMRYFIDGKHETSYLFEDELLTEKP